VVTRSWCAGQSCRTAHGSHQRRYDGYTQVLDGSLREAVDKVGGELITIVHKTGKEDSPTAA